MRARFPFSHPDPMKRVIRILLCAAALACFSSSTVLAQRVAVGARVGTLGPGVEVTGGITSRINARLAFHRLDYARQDEIEDEVTILADTKVTLSSFSLLGDYYPFQRAFRVTAGLVFNDNEINALATPTGTYTLNGKAFGPEKIGTLSARVGHKQSVQPYAGIGFGNSVAAGHRARIGLAFDLGVLFTGSPRIEMEGTGMIAPTATQAAAMEEDVRGLTVYPNVSLGLTLNLLR